MMAAALAEGDDRPRERRAGARDPRAGARSSPRWARAIHGAGTERIEIEGVPELGGARHRIIPDRVEAGTFLVAGAITGRRRAPCGTLRAGPSERRPRPSSRRPARASRSAPIASASGPRPTAGHRCRDQSVPGVPTDMQAQMMALLRPRRRLERDHRDDLREPLHARGGAPPPGRAHRDRRAAARWFAACPRYQGAPVMATDLRASASPGARGLAAERRRPKCRASITSTAATRPWSRSSRRSARASAGSGEP